MINRLKNILFILLYFPIILLSKEIIFSEKEGSWIKNNPEITYSEINWKPLSIIENNRMNGIMGDYLDLVSKKSGLKFKFIPSDSWPHVLEQFSQKKIDIVPGVGQSPQEKKLGFVSIKYANYPMVIVTNQKYQYLEGLEKLKGKTIAVPKYYTSYNFLVKNYPYLKLISTKDISEALFLVENGVADAFLGHIATSLYYIAENSLNNLRISGKTSFDFEHHYLIQKDNPILLSIVNKVFSSITYEERENIYSKWIQTSVVEERIDYTIIYIILIFFIIMTLAFIYKQSLLKKYNSKLESSYDDMQNIMNSTMGGIVISENKICINVNNPALKIFKCTKDEIIGKSLLDLVPKSSKKIVAKALSKANVEPYETELLLFDGTVIPTLVKGTTVNLKNKKVRVSSFIDISELKQQEKLLIEQSKMVAMGEMAGTLAHQWRQPLSSITSIAGSWKVFEELGELDKNIVFEGADTIVSKAEHLSKTIDSFMYLFESEKATTSFYIEEVFDRLFKVEESFLDMNNIKLISNIKTSKKINADMNRFLQAFMNIINNSIDVLSQSDTKYRVIMINTKEQDNSLIITIKDSGGGFKEDVKEKVFEPYFSTKDNLNGFGLGLYMTYTIIKKIGGKIEASNETFEYKEKELSGAKITVTIPTN